MRYAELKDGIVLYVGPCESLPLLLHPGAGVVEVTGADPALGAFWNGSAFVTAPAPDLSPIYQKLWQAAHDYEYAQVSGSAVGLLAMGVMQGKTKCTAVQTWIKNIWSLYYYRKALVSAETPDSYFDFSSVGACPYTIPELMAELGL